MSHHTIISSYNPKNKDSAHPYIIILCRLYTSTFGQNNQMSTLDVESLPRWSVLNDPGAHSSFSNLSTKPGRSAGAQPDEQKEEEEDDIDPLSSAVASAEKSKFPVNHEINKKIVLW